MNYRKLTVNYSFIIGVFSLLLTSCTIQSDSIDHNVFRNNGIPMTGSQVVPPNSSTATGTLDVLYVRGSHTLNYTVTWTGLSGAPATGTGSGQFAGNTFPAIGIYGLADPGFMAFPYAGLSNFTNGVAQSITSGFPAAASGTYSGSLYVDDVLIKDSDLLNGKFYLMIRTAGFPNGQLRAQIYFR